MVIFRTRIPCPVEWLLWSWQYCPVFSHPGGHVGISEFMLLNKKGNEAARKDDCRPLSSSHRSSHNYLRITRMLKSLGELGLEHLKFPFLTCVLPEVLLEKTLANARTSCLHYWIHTLKDDDERQRIQDLAFELLGKPENYSWLRGETDLPWFFSPKKKILPKNTNQCLYNNNSPYSRVSHLMSCSLNTRGCVPVHAQL